MNILYDLGALDMILHLKYFIQHVSTNAKQILFKQIVQIFFSFSAAESLIIDIMPDDLTFIRDRMCEKWFTLAHF